MMTQELLVDEPTEYWTSAMNQEFGAQVGGLEMKISVKEELKVKWECTEETKSESLLKLMKPKVKVKVY